jgi:2-polyprenyl-3-methyl-5-hydroxy-6-metoxy-1,4-benzoquinol methylase
MIGAARYEYPIDVSAGSRQRVLLEWIGPNKRVLELGCSTGFFSKVMAERGCAVTGVEYDSEAAQQARRFCETVAVRDLNCAEWRAGINGPFDVILMGDVLEHLLAPERILEECRELLGSDGSVIVSLPNVAHWRNRIDLLLGRWNYTEIGTLDRTHVKFFTLETSRKLIQKAGYEIEKVHSVGRGYGLFPGLFGFQFLYKAHLPTPKSSG